MSDSIKNKRQQEVYIVGNGGRTTQCEVCDSASALYTMDAFTGLTHNGRTWQISKIYFDVADDADIIILLRTGASACCQTWEVTTEANAILRSYTRPTISAGASGTLIPKRNRNAMATAASATTEYYSQPTLVATGSMVAEYFLPGGDSNWFTTGNRTKSGELIFAPNTEYIAIITNKGGGIKDIGLFISWNEIDPTMLLG